MSVYLIMLLTVLFVYFSSFPMDQFLCMPGLYVSFCCSDSSKGVFLGFDLAGNVTNCYFLWEEYWKYFMSMATICHRFVDIIYKVVYSLQGSLIISASSMLM